MNNGHADDQWVTTDDFFRPLLSAHNQSAVATGAVTIRRALHYGSVLTITISGPQGSGKTTLAMALGKRLGVPVFSRDPLMTVLQEAGMPLKARRGRKAVPAVGLELQTALLKRSLELGQSCVLECVMSSVTRTLWHQMTAQADGRFISVECVCSDPAEHRTRFERRQRGQANHRPGRADRCKFDWAYVEATMRRYQPDKNPDYLADSIQPVENLVTGILTVIGKAEEA